MVKTTDFWATYGIISTDEYPSLRIESSAITINLRGVSTKLNKYIVFTMQTYKKPKRIAVGIPRFDGLRYYQSVFWFR